MKYPSACSPDASPRSAFRNDLVLKETFLQAPFLVCRPRLYSPKERAPLVPISRAADFRLRQKNSVARAQVLCGISKTLKKSSLSFFHRNKCSVFSIFHYFPLFFTTYVVGVSAYQAWKHMLYEYCEYSQEYRKPKPTFYITVGIRTLKPFKSYSLLTISLAPRPKYSTKNTACTLLLSRVAVLKLRVRSDELLIGHFIVDTCNLSLKPS